MVQLEQEPPSRKLSLTPVTAHAQILNEYGWLWLSRDGTPTLLTSKLYPSLPYPHATAEERLRRRGSVQSFSRSGHHPPKASVG